MDLADRLGKYELVSHLASGGMASVYLARVSGLGGFQRHVVLKTLSSADASDDQFVPMFLDEARLVATLHHQHIAQVFEVGEDDGTYYLAMEYVHGETVRNVLETMRERGRRLPLDFGLSVVAAAAAGLHHAHERRQPDGTSLGIVHRDVTPSNVIASFDGSIKLIDFGIAKAAVRNSVTRSGLIKGKVGYMAPEQVRGYKVDRRSDVFALGVLLYELTTQARAFDGDSQFEQLERTARGELTPPSQMIAGYPSALEQIVLRALEVDPDDRFPSALAMRIAILQVAADLGLTLGEVPVMRVLAELFGAPPEPWLGGSHDKRRSTAAQAHPIATPPHIIDHAALARGSRQFAAIPGDIDDTPVIEVELDDDDVTTDPIELVVDPGRSVMVDPALMREDPTLERRPATAPATPGAVERLAPMIELAAYYEEPIAPMLPSPRAATAIVAPRRRPSRIPLLGVPIAVAITAALAFAVPANAVLGSLVVPARPVVAKPKPIAHEIDSSDVLAAAVAHAVVPTGVTVTVTSEPADAAVVLDGMKIGRTPFTGELPIGGTATLKVRLQGFTPQKLRVSLDRDVNWSVKLRARTQP